MKELFKTFPKIFPETARDLVLADTCFIVDMLEKNKEKELLAIEFSMTSFNIEELLHISSHLDHNIKHDIRHFFSKKTIKILKLPIHPGNKDHERRFVNSVDTELLKLIHDPSDAVLVAAAILTRSTILTKDKHHLFTVQLENYLQKYGIAIHKELKDIS